MNYERPSWRWWPSRKEELKKRAEYEREKRWAGVLQRE